MQHPTQTAPAVPLQDLIREAEQNNPEILAARHGYEAARQAPKAAGALPDTEVTVQQFSVGSPRPFAGYTNSDFAYIGFGVSQDLPYPGKLKLIASGFAALAGTSASHFGSAMIWETLINA